MADDHGVVALGGECSSCAVCDGDIVEDFAAFKFEVGYVCEGLVRYESCEGILRLSGFLCYSLSVTIVRVELGKLTIFHCLPRQT